MLAMSAAPLAFDDHGDGPPVILLHGHPFNRSLWHPQCCTIVAAGFRVIAPDLRGYGESPATSGTVTMAELASDVSALSDQLALGLPAVIGLSMGGLVAMELATSRRALAGLGLVATTARPVTAGEQRQRRMSAAKAEAEGMAPLVEQMRKGLFHPSCPPAVIDDVTAMMESNNPAGAAAALRGRAIRPDYRPRLRRLKIPTFVCAGTVDPWSTQEVTEEIVACLDHPEVAILPGVGHLPNLEAPAEFDRRLIRFLRSLW